MIDLAIPGQTEVQVGRTRIPALVGSRSTASDKHFLVCFSGAVTNRAGTTPPYFSGLGMAAEIGIPLLSFSDPTLDRSDDLALAFYAGNSDEPELPARMAEVVSEVAARSGRRPILLGGSGGGFAALNLIQLGVDGTALVMNPQTSISDYETSAVQKYLAVAFPDAWAKSTLSQQWSKERAAKFMDELGLHHRISGPLLRGEVVYLQNRSDWHLMDHCGPFMRQMRWRRLGASTFGSEDGRAALYVGDWGSGHAVVPKPIVLSTLRHLIEGQPIDRVVNDLAQSQPSSGGQVECLTVGRNTLSAFGLSTTLDRERIRAVVSISDAVRSSCFTYAFHLHTRNEVTKQVFYGPTPEVEFETADDGPWAVTALIRDEFGNKRVLKAQV